MFVPRPLCVLSLVLMLMVSVADAQSPPAWDELPIPGGHWAFAELGVAATTPRAQAFDVLVRRLFDPQPQIGISEPTVLAVLAHLEFAAQFHDALTRAAGPQGLSLVNLSNRGTRDRVKAVLELAGLELKEHRRVYTAVLDKDRAATERRVVLLRLGVHAEAMVTALNAGESIWPRPEVLSLPIPMSAAVLTERLLGRDSTAEHLFIHLLRDRRALLFVHGLMSMGPGAVATITEDRELFDALLQAGGGSMSSSGSFIDVVDGRVTIPGGPIALALWQDLVDEPANKPAAFMRRLLTRDTARLAGFFDTIARLTPDQQSFVLGLWMKAPEERTALFRDLYDVFRSADEAINWQEQPFVRRPQDPASLLHLIAADATRPGNGLIGPQWRKFWEKALTGHDELPNEPANELKNVQEDGLLTASWLLRRVLSDVPRRSGFFHAFLAVQRSFSEPSDIDLSHILVIARAWLTYPALPRTLDRIGVKDPAIVVSALVRADALAKIDTPLDAAVPLFQFQSAVALVERMRVVNTIDAATAATLIQQLAALPISERGYGDTVAEWLATAIGLPLNDGTDAVNAALLQALAGPRSPAPTVVEWEGEKYQIDIAKAELQRLTALRKRQQTPDLSSIFRLMATLREMRAPVRDLAAGQKLAAQFSADVKRLPKLPTNALLKDAPDAWRELAKATSDLKLQRPRDLERLQKAATRATPMVEFLFANALVAWVYLPALGDPDNLLLAAGEVSSRHDFGSAIEQSKRRFVPWHPATQVRGSGQPWHLAGTLLGLDVAMSDLSLSRLSDDQLPEQPVLPEPVTMGLTGSLPLWNDALEEPRVSAAIASGRAMLSAAITPAAIDAFAVRAGISGVRRRLLPWMLQHERERIPEVVTLRELVLSSGVEAQRLQRYGNSTEGGDGRLATTFPAVGDSQRLAGRPSTGLVSMFMVDLNLRVLELLEELKVPVALYRPVMTYALRHFIDTARPRFTEDVTALALHSGALTRAKVEDFISALAGRGWLHASTTPGAGR